MTARTPNVDSPDDPLRRALDVFDAVCDLSSKDRDRALDEHCQNDLTLRATVEQMLAQDVVSSDFQPGQGAELLATHLEDSSSCGLVGERMGRYTIVREIGRGGMGVVYEAEQEEPRRRVAVKVIRDGQGNVEILQRFQREAEFLGRLQHPGIASIYEAGSEPNGPTPRSFYAMEYVEGLSIDQHAEQARLNTDERIELLARVCDAIAHAHQKGVLHRDLKAGNVLVTTTHSASTGDTTTATSIDRIGQPKIVDFGIARLTDMGETWGDTRVGQVIGSLSCMSPEQLRGDLREVDTRTDVYALGVLLYRLLAGRPPLDLSGLTFPQAARIVTDHTPERLSHADPRLKGDISLIAAKALDADLQQRYGSVAQLGDDLRRFLRSEPVSARPATTWYQLKKFTRRNRALVGGVATTLLALIVGLISTMLLLGRVAEERDTASLATQRQQEIAEFQSSLLDTINLDPMATAIRTELHRQAAAHLEPAQLNTFSVLLSAVDTSLPAERVFQTSVVDQARKQLDDGYTNDPIVEATLRRTVGQMYLLLNRRQLALEQWQKGYRVVADAYGEDHRFTLEQVPSVAYGLFRLHRREESALIVNTALDRLSQSASPLDPLVLRLRMEKIALLPMNQERLAQLTTLLADYDRSDDVPQDEYESCYLALAYVESVIGSKDRALQMFEARLLDRFDSNDWNQSTLSQAQLLAELYFITKRYDEALATYRDLGRAITTRRGIAHPLAVVALEGEFRTLFTVGRLEEADAVARSAEKILRERLGFLSKSGHEMTLWLAKGYELMEQPQRGLRLITDALVVYELRPEEGGAARKHLEQLHAELTSKLRGKRESATNSPF